MRDIGEDTASGTRLLVKLEDQNSSLHDLQVLQLSDQAFNGALSCHACTVESFILKIAVTSSPDGPARRRPEARHGRSEDP